MLFRIVNFRILWIKSLKIQGKLEFKWLLLGNRGPWVSGPACAAWPWLIPWGFEVNSQENPQWCWGDSNWWPMGRNPKVEIKYISKRTWVIYWCRFFYWLKQWPYEAAAVAFEAIPRTLAQNCGVNVIRTMTALQGKVRIFLSFLSKWDFRCISYLLDEKAAF